MTAATTYTERDGSEIVDYDTFSVEYRDASHSYWLHEEGKRTRALSVTSALKVLDKPALIAWAERCGAEGAAILAKQGELDGVPIEDTILRVRMFNLGADAKRDAGADRGSIVHAVLAEYSTSGTVPTITDFEPQVRGYVQALCRWLLVRNPTPLAVERIVGSPDHGYAGRIDLLAEIDGLRYVVDLKTNPAGRTYDEAHLQTAAYLGCLEGCGFPDVIGSVLVAAGADGSFEQVTGEAALEDFLSVLGTARVMSRLRNSRAARERVVKAAV